MKITLLIALAAIVTAAPDALAGDQVPAKAKKDTPATASSPSQAAQKQTARKDQKVLLTGSHIKQKIRRNGRVTNGANPVVVLDRETIDLSGAATLRQLLRHESFH
jgi:hypothetical protein